MDGDWATVLRRGAWHPARTWGSCLPEDPAHPLHPPAGLARTVARYCTEYGIHIILYFPKPYSRKGYSKAPKVPALR